MCLFMGRVYVILGTLANYGIYLPDESANLSPLNTVKLPQITCFLALCLP